MYDSAKSSLGFRVVDTLSCKDTDVMMQSTLILQIYNPDAILALLV